MAIPSQQRQEYYLRGFGADQYPQSVILGTKFWTVFMNFGRLVFQEFEGATYIVDLRLEKFVLTNKKLPNHAFSTTNVLIWGITTENKVFVYDFNLEAEPVLEEAVQLNVLSRGLSVSMFEGKPAVYAAFLQLSEKVSFLAYLDYHNNPVASEDLDWTENRLYDFDLFFKSLITLSYSKIGSPPNIYTTDYDLSIPQIISAAQVGESKRVSLSWDKVIGAEYYRVERATDPLFSDAVTIYYGAETAFIDTTPDYGTYYYHSKMVIPTLSEESDWSDPVEVIVAKFIKADFSAEPVYGAPDLCVQFRDLSYGASSWFWDFGDGEFSTEQNPVHIYTNYGKYTVSLSINGGVSVETKIDYIVVEIRADFLAVPQTTYVRNPIRFNNLSIGALSWLWDFGDGSTSAQQNPVHHYVRPGLYTVSLTITGRTIITTPVDTEIKIDYIRILPAKGRGFISELLVSAEKIEGVKEPRKYLSKTEKKSSTFFKEVRDA